MSDPYTEPHYATSALITIDTQRDVLDGGPFEVPGTSAALGNMTELLRAFREGARPIVHIVRLYEQDGGNVDLCRRHAVETGTGMLTPGTDGSELAPALMPAPGRALEPRLLLDGRAQQLAPGEAVIYKPRWGAFYRTPLHEHLRGHGATTPVFCGCNFPNCPRTSIYQASERDYRVVLARDAISGLYERGERELLNIGVRVIDTREVIEGLRAARTADAGALERAG